MNNSKPLLDKSKFLKDYTHTSKFDFMIFSNSPYLHSPFENTICNYMKSKGHRIYYFYNGYSEEAFTVIDEDILCINLKLFLPNSKDSTLKHSFDSLIKKDNVRFATMYTCDNDFQNISSFLSKTYGFSDVSNTPYNSSIKDFYEAILSSFQLASIIVLTYNNLQYTKDCIESILKYTQYPNYEIVIIDNASSDDTPSYLLELEKSNGNIKVFLNNENSGFAKGNNLAIKLCKGEYIVFLNNDTIVTKGWLCNLIKYYKFFGNSYGLICPVTNCICSKAKILTNYTDIDGMHDFAEKYVSNNLNHINDRISMIAMFCTIITKEILSTVGVFDENFKIGTFEDDDYCHRAQLAGYKLAIAHDVFIHHKGSASMNTLSKAKLRSIWVENKKYFETKWKTRWKPH